MKSLFTLIALMALPQWAGAWVLCDSRVLTLPEMERLGVQITAEAAPGPKDARRLRVNVLVFRSDRERTYKFMEFCVLEKVLDADFASTEGLKVGVRDTKRWAGQVRGDSSEKRTMTFLVAEAELARSYLVVNFDLPPTGGCELAFGKYYLLLRELGSAAGQKPDPAPKSVTAPAGQEPRQP